MRKKQALAAFVLALAAPLATVASAGAVPTESTAQILGPIRVNDDGTATVTARYVCTTEFHLWVSAKQAEGGQPDKAMQEEGSGAASEAWLESHPQNFTCDGEWHTGSFVITADEQGHGELEQGQAWVQFCLVSADAFLSKTRWVAVV